MVSEKGHERSALVHPENRGLTKRTSELARRGIASLSRTVWKTKRLLENEHRFVRGTISPAGRVYASSTKYCFEELQCGLIQEQIIEVVDFDRPSNRFSMNAPPAFPQIVYSNKTRQEISESDLQGMLKNGECPENGEIYAQGMGAMSYTWSPCGKYLVTGSKSGEGALRLFDLNDKKYRKCFGKHVTRSLVWSSSGDYIISAAETMKLWRCVWAEDRQEREVEGIVYQKDVVGLKGIETSHLVDQQWRGLGSFAKPRFSSDGSFLATIAFIHSDSDRIIIFELPDLNEVNRIVGMGRIQCVSWTPNGNLMFATNNGELFSWNLESNDAISTGLSFDVCECHPKYDVIALAKGRTVIIFDENNKPIDDKFIGGLISIRKLSDYSIISEFTSSSGIQQLRWSSDGNKLWAVCNDGTIVQGVLPIAFRK
jgi:WD40 repeat protein